MPPAQLCREAAKLRQAAAGEAAEEVGAPPPAKATGVVVLDDALKVGWYAASSVEHVILTVLALAAAPPSCPTLSSHHDVAMWLDIRVSVLLNAAPGPGR